MNLRDRLNPPSANTEGMDTRKYTVDPNGRITYLDDEGNAIPEAEWTAQHAPVAAPKPPTHEQVVEKELRSIRQAAWTIATLLIITASVGLVFWGIVTATVN